MTEPKVERSLSFPIFTGQEFTVSDNAFLISGQSDAAWIVVPSDAALASLIRSPGKTSFLFSR
jgi:hypothetical protein